MEIEFSVIEHLRPEAAIDEGANMLDEHAELILRDRFSSLLHIDCYHQPIRNCWLGLLSGGCNRAPKTKRCCGKRCNPYPQSSPSCLSPSCRFFAVTPCPDLYPQQNAVPWTQIIT